MTSASLEEFKTNSPIIEGLQLKNFTTLGDKALKRILEWRNHPKVKEWMLNQETINLDQHLAFVDRLKRTEDKRYFLVKLKEKEIGIIDFYDINSEKKSCFYGYYLKPELIGSSLGILLEYLVAEYAFGAMKMENLIAETKTENVRAMQLHSKFGFCKTGSNERNLVEANLNREAWDLNKNLFTPIIKRLTS